MSDVRGLHREAMDLAEAAFLMRLQGETEAAQDALRQAFELEREAAEAMRYDTAAEPTRSVLYRSAASLALDCSELREAERLIMTALVGNPSEDVADELRDIYEAVNFERHLRVRGVHLHAAEVQMSVAGRDVGYGIAPTDVFVNRVNDTEKVIVRTVERTSGRRFRERGRPAAELRADSELYMTVPRAASLAVTLRVGRSQLAFEGMDRPLAAIDELLDCLDLFQHSDIEGLRARITDDAYYNNFIGLAQRIAPDGERVSLVGFTAVRGASERTVALTGRPTPFVPVVEEGARGAGARSVTIQGALRYADSTHTTNVIKLLETESKKQHVVVVPEGMMSDIVKPLWDDTVTVTGLALPRGKVLLQGISPVSGSGTEE